VVTGVGAGIDLQAALFTRYCPLALDLLAGAYGPFEAFLDIKAARSASSKGIGEIVL
jgi:hypothetical protein